MLHNRKLNPVVYENLEEWEEDSRGRGHMFLYDKPTQYCREIILQFKILLKKTTTTT